MVGEVTLDHGNDRAAHDRHAEQPGALARVPAEAHSASAKIVGNMIELQSPIASTLHIAV